MRIRRQRDPYEPPELIAQADYSIVAAVALLALGICWWPGNYVPRHSLTFDIPVNGVFGDPLAWETSGDQHVNVLSPKADGTIEWNGREVSHEELHALLALGLFHPVEPQIVFAPDANASYDLAARALRSIKQSGATKFCFAELERHQNFGKNVAEIRANVSFVPPSDRVVELSRSIGPPGNPPPRCSMPPELTARD